MINIILFLFALLVLTALLHFFEAPPNHSNESSSPDKSLTPSEKRLQDARGKLFDFKSDTLKMVEMHHGDSHMRMSLRREHQDLVNNVRDAEKEVYGEPITPKAEDWRSLP